ncbi:GntR family transcriptional regulator [Ruegeria pomeroyi]|uniref:GntR family transcriptional regulator n=1 Tax=Ruegeria pomeroyi TaxID=89184 RepID=A0A9Q3WK40_9RHOB|nr:GntR family transcriptional regulator [Ruegeria pomeroyi]MCE8536993.1 GntR family transcriptional regulator [Ruegeria pomeroyi]
MQTGGGVRLPAGAKSRRVYLSLLEQISAGRLGPSQKLPGEEQLAEDYGVSRVTVRRALDALAENGLLSRRAGSGTRVRPRPAAPQPVTMDFSTLLPQLVEIGRRTEVRLLSSRIDQAPEHVARALGLAPGEPVQIARRTRSIGGTAYSHLTTFVPSRIAAGISDEDLSREPLHVLLERNGVKIADARQSVSATLAGPEVAMALGLPEGTALLSLDRVVRDAEGRGVEFLSGLYRPDMFRLDMSLTRVDHASGRYWEPAITPLEETPR